MQRGGVTGSSSQSDSPIRLAGVALSQDGGDLSVDALSFLKQCRAAFGELDAAKVTHENFARELLFELLDVAAHGGLARRELLGGLRERPGLDDLEEALEQGPIHVLGLFKHEWQVQTFPQW
jgi:hypothetical protein